MRTIKVSKKTRTLRCKNNSYNHDHISYNIFLQTTKLSVLSFRVGAIQIHSFKARRLKLCMQPLIIVGRVMGDMRPASEASEAIEAEVSLKVWNVLHGILRWADGPCEASLCDLRGHRGRGFTVGLGRSAWHFKMGVGV